jgi:hypothetical protein
MAAPNSTQQNTISTIQDIALQLLVIRSTMTNLVQLYTNLGLANLTDADFAAIPSFASLTAANFQAAGAALVAIVGTIGDYTSPTSNASKLIKIVNTVPK